MFMMIVAARIPVHKHPKCVGWCTTQNISLFGKYIQHLWLYSIASVYYSLHVYFWE